MRPSLVGPAYSNRGTPTVCDICGPAGPPPGPPPRWALTVVRQRPRTRNRLALERKRDLRFVIVRMASPIYHAISRLATSDHKTGGVLSAALVRQSYLEQAT